jgi:hypothetical protein
MPGLQLGGGHGHRCQLYYSWTPEQVVLMIVSIFRFWICADLLHSTRKVSRRQFLTPVYLETRLLPGEASSSSIASHPRPGCWESKPASMLEQLGHGLPNGREYWGQPRGMCSAGSWDKEVRPHLEDPVHSRGATRERHGLGAGAEVVGSEVKAFIQFCKCWESLQKSLSLPLCPLLPHGCHLRAF